MQCKIQTKILTQQMLQLVLCGIRQRRWNLSGTGMQSPKTFIQLFYWPHFLGWPDALSKGGPFPQRSRRQGTFSQNVLRPARLPELDKENTASFQPGEEEVDRGDRLSASLLLLLSFLFWRLPVQIAIEIEGKITWKNDWGLNNTMSHIEEKANFMSYHWRLAWVVFPSWQMS